MQKIYCGVCHHCVMQIELEIMGNRTNAANLLGARVSIPLYLVISIANRRRSRCHRRRRRHHLQPSLSMPSSSQFIYRSTPTKREHDANPFYSQRVLNLRAHHNCFTRHSHQYTISLSHTQLLTLCEMYYFLCRLFRVF